MAYKGPLCNGKVQHQEAQGGEEPGGEEPGPCAAPELATREGCVPAAEDGSAGCCAAAASLPLQENMRNCYMCTYSPGKLEAEGALPPAHYPAMGPCESP